MTTPSIGILGAGQIGSAIARALSGAGIPATLHCCPGKFRA